MPRSQQRARHVPFRNDAGSPELPPRTESSGVARVQRKLIALDVGDVRTGVAVSDELGLFAHPRGTIEAASLDELVRAVERLARDEAAAEVVVGLPLTLSGGSSAQTGRVHRVVDALRHRLEVPVVTWDERLTTAEAARLLRGGRARRRERVDETAATLVLQAVLDSRRGATP